MVMSSTRFHQLATLLAASFGLLAVGGGIYSLVDPIAAAVNLGLRVHSPSSPAFPFVFLIGACDFSIGLSMLALIFTKQIKAAGIVLMAGVPTAMLDAWVCSNYGSEEGKATGHAVGGIIFGILGIFLYRGYGT